MKTYKTQAEVDADTIDGTLRVKDDVLFTCDTVLQKHLIVSGSIEAGWSIKGTGPSRRATTTEFTVVFLS